MTKRSAWRYAYLASFLYVGFGTVTVLSIYPDNWLYGEWAFYALLLTFPVNMISFGILYADPSQHLLVLLVQTIVFFLAAKIIYRLIFKHRVSGSPE